jgi:bis(5'-nucleosidyl)-tetraphosphatase
MAARGGNKIVLSCGGIPFRVKSGDIELLLIQHYAGHWGFPKGRREAFDADDIANAIREISEETGLSNGKTFSLVLPESVQFVEQYTYKRKGVEIQKKVVLFLAFVEAEAEIAIPKGELKDGR